MILPYEKPVIARLACKPWQSPAKQERRSKINGIPFDRQEIPTDAVASSE